MAGSGRLARGGSSGGSHANGGRGGTGGGVTAGSSNGHASAGQRHGGASAGGSGAQPNDHGGGNDGGADDSAGEGDAGGVAGTSPSAGTAGAASGSGGSAGGATASGGATGGAGVSGSAGTTGVGGGAGISGAGGTGGGGECSSAAECVAAYGARGCGVWECSAGQCEVQIRCDDEDQDGFWVGADCTCAGKALDCDDGDPEVDDAASTSCCDGGTRACTGGIWGICSTRGGETCNGADDDCDGVADDLPEVSCGLGACRITVPSCTGNAPTACIPPAPTTNIDDCNGIDDDCDGAVDEDCSACIHVAPDGDDALAATSSGATPFATIQAAIDFTDAHRSLAHQVCVAAGAACGATATYVGSASVELTMRDGIGVLGNYESSGWTRCNDSVTTLEPKTARGVVFPSNIALATALDGFTLVYGFDSSAPATGVTVDGAHGALLTNLIVTGPTQPFYTVATGEGIGIDILHGASATIARSMIAGHVSSGYTAAVRSVGAQVFVEDNCSGQFEAGTGRCLGPCAIQGMQALGADEDAILLTDSPGSRVERSSVCASSTSGWSSDPLAMHAVRVSGASAGVVLRANTLAEGSYQDTGHPGPTERAVVSLEECAGAAPWIADNDSIVLTTQTDGDAVLSIGDCHPVIERNVSVTARQLRASNTRGVQCRTGSLPSRCTIAGNDFSSSGHTNYGIHGAVIDFPQATTTGGAAVNVSGTGILCQGQSCGDVRGNLVIGEDNEGNCASKCNLSSTGLALGGGNVEVRDNTIDAGLPVAAQSFSAYGINGVTTGEITGNELSALVFTRANLFENNTSETKVSWSGDGGSVRSNCFKSATSTFAFGDAGTGHGPAEFTNNHLQAPSVLYADGSNDLTSIDQVNALTDMVSSGNDTLCP
jgi:hypothetical protein